MYTCCTDMYVEVYMYMYYQTIVDLTIGTCILGLWLGVVVFRSTLWADFLSILANQGKLTGFVAVCVCFCMHQPARYSRLHNNVSCTL